MRVYTRTGDKGTTALASGERVAKTDLRIEAYGTADELNSFVGLLRACLSEQPIDAETDALIDEHLGWTQNMLFNLGALLSEAPGLWIDDDDVRRLEGWMDQMEGTLEPLRAFVLPAGDRRTAMTHVCRTVTRRLERRMIEMEAPEVAIRVINRLSDYFFVLGRFVAKNAQIEQKVWKNEKKV